MAIFCLAGCKDSRVDDLQAQLDRLQKTLDRHGQSISDLDASHENLQRAFSEFDDITFSIDNLQYEVVEKAFEPLLMGEADLTLEGPSLPDLIFVEWSLKLSVGSDQLDPISFIQRVENGKTKLRFGQPLPRHNIKPSQLTLKVVPSAWYLGHLANVK